MTTIGTGAGHTATSSAINNVFVGWRSGATITTGSRNTLVGALSGENATGSGNVLIGYNAAVTTSNQLVISNGTALLSGDFTTGNLAIGGAQPSWGSANHTVTLYDTTNAPVAAPSGGLHVYSDSGRLRVVGSTGVATIALSGETAASVTAISGSAVAPSVGFNGRSTGFYESATDQIGLAIAGVKKTIITSAQWNFTNQYLQTTGGATVQGAVNIATDARTDSVNIATNGARQVAIGNNTAHVEITRAGISFEVRQSSINTTALVRDTLIEMSPSGSTLTVTLPLAASVPGKMYIVANMTGTAMVLIAANASDTIEGQAAVSLVQADEHANFLSNGVSRWYVW